MAGPTDPDTPNPSAAALIRAVEAYAAADPPSMDDRERVVRDSVYLTRHCDTDPAAAELQAALRRLLAGEWNGSGDPATTIGFLARQVGRPALGEGGEGDTRSRLDAAELTTAQIKALPTPAPLIAGILSLDSLAVLYGPSGAGKSFLTLDWALHTAVGAWWHGHEIVAGPVIYIVAEGRGHIGSRIESWETHHQMYGLDSKPLHWLPLPVNLTDENEVGALAGYCQARRPVLIVVDTLARCTLGAEENSAKDMGRVVEHLDHLRRCTTACVLAVHHTGKDMAAGARGSSALRAAVDTEIEAGATDDRLTVKVTKQKDGPEPAPVRLDRKTVGASCVLVAAGQGDSSDGLTTGALETLEALRRIEVPGGIAASAWQMSVGVAPRTFYMHRKALLSAGLVDNVGTERTPRYVTLEEPEPL